MDEGASNFGSTLNSKKSEDGFYRVDNTRSIQARGRNFFRGMEVDEELISFKIEIFHLSAEPILKLLNDLCNLVTSFRFTTENGRLLIQCNPLKVYKLKEVLKAHDLIDSIVDIQRVLTLPPSPDNIQLE